MDITKSSHLSSVHFGTYLAFQCNQRVFTWFLVSCVTKLVQFV